MEESCSTKKGLQSLHDICRLLMVILFKEKKTSSLGELFLVLSNSLSLIWALCWQLSIGWHSNTTFCLLGTLQPKCFVPEMAHKWLWRQKKGPVFVEALPIWSQPCFLNPKLWTRCTNPLQKIYMKIIDTNWAFRFGNPQCLREVKLLEYICIGISHILCKDLQWVPCTRFFLRLCPRCTPYDLHSLMSLSDHLVTNCTSASSSQNCADGQ